MEVSTLQIILFTSHDMLIYLHSLCEMNETIYSYSVYNVIIARKHLFGAL